MSIFTVAHIVINSLLQHSSASAHDAQVRALRLAVLVDDNAALKRPSRESRSAHTFHAFVACFCTCAIVRQAECAAQRQLELEEAGSKVQQLSLEEQSGTKGGIWRFPSNRHALCEGPARLSCVNPHAAGRFPQIWAQAMQTAVYREVAAVAWCLQQRLQLCRGFMQSQKRIECMRIAKSVCKMCALPHSSMTGCLFHPRTVRVRQQTIGQTKPCPGLLQCMCWTRWRGGKRLLGSPARSRASSLFRRG